MSHPRIGSLLSAFLTLLPIAVTAQQPADLSTESALRARTILERGITVMGGLANLQRLSDITRELSGTRTDAGQGLEPGRSSSNRPRVLVVSDLRGQRFFRDLHDTILGGQPLGVRLSLTPSGGFSANLANHTTSEIPAASVRNSLATQGRRWPETILLAAWNRPEGLRFLGHSKGKQSETVISYADFTGATINLGFQASTGLLTRAEWLVDDPIFGDASTEVLFQDWRRTGDLLLPYRYIDRVGGKVLQTLDASAIRLNSPPADSLFLVPPGFSPSPGDGIGSEKLAEGIFLLRGGYASLVVVQDDGVMVLEAGGSSGSGARQLAEIAKLAPGKPVRWVVATHFHHDHLSGLRPFIASGATVLTTPEAAAVVRSAAVAPHRLRPDTLSRAPRAPVIETITSQRSFGSGERQVDLYQIGPSPHVNQMLVAYLPALHLLFEADVLDLSDGRPYPGGNDTVHLAEWIRRSGLTVDRIVAVHGGLGPAAALDSALALR